MKPHIKMVLLLIAFVGYGNQAFSQYHPTIRTARPGQSFGPFATGKGVFQVQTGFNFKNAELNTMNEDLDGFNYLLSLRYGVTETFEIRSAFQFNRDRISHRD